MIAGPHRTAGGDMMYAWILWVNKNHPQNIGRCWAPKVYGYLFGKSLIDFLIVSPKFANKEYQTLHIDGYPVTGPYCGRWMVSRRLKKAWLWQGQFFFGCVDVGKDPGKFIYMCTRLYEVVAYPGCFVPESWTKYLLLFIAFTTVTRSDACNNTRKRPILVLVTCCQPVSMVANPSYDAIV